MIIYLKWFFYALLNIPYTFYAWLFASHYAKEVDETWMLPEKYRAFQTPDAFNNGMGFGGLGKGGDRGFYNAHINADPIDTATEWMRRNTLHGKRCWDWGIDYGEHVLRNTIIPQYPTDYLVFDKNRETILGFCHRVSGNFTFDERNGEGHFHYVYIEGGEKVKAFMYYCNIHFKLPIIGEKRLRLKLGWDLWQPSYWPENTPRMFVCSIGIHRIKE